MEPQFNINLVPTPDNRPGYAVFRLPKKWLGSKNEVDITISQNTKHLQSSSGETYIWGSSPEIISLQSFTQEGDFYQTILSPEIVNALVRATAQTSDIVLHDKDGVTLAGRLNIKQGSGIFDSTAAANPNPQPTVEPKSTPVPVLEPEVPTPEPEPKLSVPEPAPEPEPQPAPRASTPTSKNNNLKILLYTVGAAILAILLIGVALWWWINKDHNSTIDPLGRVKASETTSTACDVSKIGSNSDVEFIQNCLKENPSSQELLDVIAQAKKSEQCSIAQRLYANKSQSGDVAIASAYVKEYDPKYHEPSVCFAAPAVDTAIYWYEIIINNDPNKREAQKRLDELKK